MRQLIRRLCEWQVRSCVDYLERNAVALPSRDYERATEKRISYYERHLSEGTNWRVSKQIMELRLRADEWLREIAKCERKVQRAKWFVRKGQLLEKLNLVHASGKVTSNFEQAAQHFSDCRKTWEGIVSKARQARNPLFASQAFLGVSERSGLQIASLVIGGLIVLGAVQMLFFYRAAAQQFVFAYWVWDDLVIQGINIVPIILILLFVTELLFRVLRFSGEKSGHLRPVLLVLHNPGYFALILFLVLMVCASGWGYIQGDAVWHDFKKTGGRQSATMLDQTKLAGVHLVGTTSRAAVFLQAKTANTEEGNTAPKRAKSIKDSAPGFVEVACDVVVRILPFSSHLLPFFPHVPTDAKPSEPKPKLTYRVYVLDRDKIVCHAEEGLCEAILPRK